MHKADNPYGQRLAGVRETGIFATPECWPPKEGTEEQIRESMGHGGEQHLPHLQPSTLTAAAHPGLQSFSLHEVGHPTHIGTAKSNFSWAAEKPCISCALNKGTIICGGAERNLEIAGVPGALEEHNHHKMAWWWLMAVRQSLIPTVLTKVVSDVSSQIVSDIATSFL